ncbi:MAG: hypothetical protein CMP26_14220 [Roseibacillus sp.]|nr:hypothetical protein [Roseibacillus sp.]HAO97070.1 hypothetical protein [Verrucomicrobiales bacterium]|tara:strand:+ start:886 stop:1488 length:603 start_codon:yes stop_codon:yes gene_type:complete
MGPHPYESIPLNVAGYVLAAYLLVVHGLMIWKAERCKEWLNRLPRHRAAGIYTLAVGMFWFWLLIAPENLGVLSSLTMDIGEFNAVKPWLRIIVPVAFVGMAIGVKEFLFVRALGVVALMASSPLLEAAFNRDPATRLLIPVFSYALLTAGLFWVGMPYTFRDLAKWATDSHKRWMSLALSGLGYGALTLLCAILFWRGH